MKVRSFLPEDSAQYLTWLKNDSKITNFDPSVYSYPTLMTLVVTKNDESILMESFHGVMIIDKQFNTKIVLMLEALAVRPGTKPKDIILGLLALYKELKNIARQFGITEIWFQSADIRFQRLVTRHGFRQVVPAMRRKLDEQTCSDPMTFLVAKISQVREVIWHPVDEEHGKHLKNKGFRKTGPMYWMASDKNPD